MASMVANGNREGASSALLQGADPETCMIVFKNHWAQVVKILEKHDPLRGGPRPGPVPGDEASAVQNYVEHMLLLLMEEERGKAGAMGPILEFVVLENVMERLFVWSLRREFTDAMKLEQLKMYEMLLCQSRQPLLHHKPVLRPLVMLLSACSGSASAPGVEAQLVLLLHQLCCVLAKDPSVLELFFHTSEDQGAANFLIFSLLIPFIHREGAVGQQARDALLLIMSLSAENPRVARHVAENTFFCPVLATGLSGLYSSLPTKLDPPNEEWHCLHRDDWLRVPSLVQFLNSLEFCNAVIQVAHPDIRDQLLGYIYNGFLVPVLAPALHKLTLEEVMTTTAYLDLFLRSISEPALLQTFLSFILLHRHENVHILDTLVSRINTPFQLGVVSLALFRTLIGLHCEDVMLQLILRYLIPCNHMMLSQRRVVRERDFYSASAAKILALTPSCCSPDRSPPPLRQLESILFSKAEKADASVKGDPAANSSCTIGSEIYLDVSYLHYLDDAHARIGVSMRACRVWSAAYDGEDPPPEKYQAGVLEEPTPLKRVQRGTTARHPSAAPNQLELEWDDSYDACPPRTAEPEILPPPSSEPPRHIEEMRKSAILLVKGSYVEENEFQDDVMVYDLVAKKDSVTGENPDPPKNGPAKSAPEPDENLLAQYEELIQTMDGEAEKCNAEAKDDNVAEDDIMDFSVETPEPEKLPSPFGATFRSAARSQSAPFTGPFVSVLLSRLENMLSNPLHVNLLLTGILAQLAAYPQPLLRSFLLNTNLVFQPTVRSLYQVLATVKNQIEQLATSSKDFPELIVAAQHWLLTRDTLYGEADKSNRIRSGGILQSSPPPRPKSISAERTDVFGTVLFGEFLKELAALAQEHSILSYIPMEE
ncbi:FHF complex subunit HOOK-interacting protein 1A [Corythoichthys intestinalis]|uniref:FHF complex subunit HOOK-interacting protein 1A n=1 Tax=Corythoichthys intestinalis TaxID=161448 RepID=UPI0025A6481E|nr:FHF complex subunit HOOK-interacting protein 1A [Corythoichthys intestinalis]